MDRDEKVTEHEAGEGDLVEASEGSGEIACGATKPHGPAEGAFDDPAPG